MKILASTLTAFVVLAGAAHAERPDTATLSTKSATSIEMRAGDFLNSRDLAEAFLAADDIVSLTTFPSNGAVDAPER